MCVCVRESLTMTDYESRQMRVTGLTLSADAIGLHTGHENEGQLFIVTVK